MRKQLILLLALCCPSLWVLAERIDVATAHRVAVNVAQQGNAAVGLRSSDEVTLVYAAAPGEKGVALRSTASDAEADYFVFNLSTPLSKTFINSVLNPLSHSLLAILNAISSYGGPDLNLIIHISGISHLSIK